MNSCLLTRNVLLYYFVFNTYCISVHVCIIRTVQETAEDFSEQRL